VGGVYGKGETAMERVKLRRRPALALLPKPSLLITESAEEFDALHDALEREIKPRGSIEQIYVADISSLTWDIVRLQRCKAGIVNAAFRRALRDVLAELLREPGQFVDYLPEEAEALALKWFTNQADRKKVSQLLGRFHLDEYAIEAEAIRMSLSDLELLDRMLSSLESRRNKALCCIGEYRDSLARQLRESSDRVIDQKGILRLEAGKKSAAA
jgi:hypothetical protein